MSEKSRPYWGKDGNHYSDYYEMQAANTRYEQKERLIQEQKEANKIIKEENENLKSEYTYNNGGNIRTLAGDISADKALMVVRWEAILLYAVLLIGGILIFSGLAINIGLYIISAGLFIEAIAVYRYNKKNKITSHFFEISLALIASMIIVITVTPISVLKNFVPIGKSTYTIASSSSVNSYNETRKIKILSFGIDEDLSTYGAKKDLDINRNIKITFNYKRYVNNKIENKILTKTVDFNPKKYFENKEKISTINDLKELYIVNLDEIIDEVGEY